MAEVMVESLEIFFYGSFMDRKVLRTLGVVPQTFEPAELKDWRITFSPMATLVRSEGDSVYGAIAVLSQNEVRLLYSRDDLKHYNPVDITVSTEGGKRVTAQCYISEPVMDQKPSVEYLQRVIQAAESLGFPTAYIAKLRRTPTTQTGGSERR
jgi:cation transport regulator ChaC